MKRRYKLVNIIKAIISRIVVITHIIFLYLSFLWRQNDFGILSLTMLAGIVLICIEGIYTILKRYGQDWKWGSPLLFIYISTAYLPCLINESIHEFSLPPESCLPNSTQTDIYKEEVTTENPFAVKTIQNAILEIFFLVVIFTRWFLPKGKISLEELSKLLLIYISAIADILDMMKMIRSLRYSKCDQDIKEQLFNLSIVALSFSVLQLCLGLTAKLRSKTSSKDLDLTKLKLKCNNKLSPAKIDENLFEKTQSVEDKECRKFKNFLVHRVYCIQKCYLKAANKLKQTFEKEIWGIVVLLLVKDVPFSFVRTYALILPPKDCTLWNQSVFFTLKNYFTIVIQINRCYVLYKTNDESNENFDGENNLTKNKNNQKQPDGTHFMLYSQISSNSSQNISSSSASSNNSTTKLVLNPCSLENSDASAETLEKNPLDKLNNCNRQNAALEINERKHFWTHSIKNNKVYSSKVKSIYSVSMTNLV